MKVHIALEPEGKNKKILLGHLNPGISCTYGKQIPEDIEALVCGVPTEEMIKTSKKLKYLFIPYAGLPKKTKDLMMNYPDIEVYNLHHNAAPTAEMALSLLLCISRKMNSIDAKFRKGDWSPRYDVVPSLLLEGKNALIIGYGRIGKRVGSVLSALAMNVFGIRKNLGNGDFAENVFQLDKLHELLPKSNVVIVTIPFSEETTDLIGEKEFGLMPKNSIIVNVSRGPVVNEKALYEALKNNRIYGAGSDVWYIYPKSNGTDIRNTFPSKYPFHELENVVMSPHRGGRVHEMESDRMTHLAHSLNAACEGREIPNRVDILAGY